MKRSNRHNSFQRLAIRAAACALSATLLGLAGLSTANADLSLASPAGVTISVQPQSGTYAVIDTATGWKFAGSVGAHMSSVTQQSGQDILGAYQQIGFHWSSNVPLYGSIRDYQARKLVMFRVFAPHGDDETIPDFPRFTAFPQGLHALSYADTEFSPPEFGLANTSTPWILFDGSYRTATLSPASDYLVSEMHGDGKTSIGSGLSTNIAHFPPGFTHESCLVFGQGIAATVRKWGNVLTTLGGKPQPSDNADRLIKYIGYWTDNGADYYYNFDRKLGYAGTLAALFQHYAGQKIPMGYLQLDSWWYQKSAISYDGKPAPGRTYLPQQSWNFFGGTIDYSASPDLFPKGLEAFQRQIGLPLVVHARWLDPNGPYAQKYKLSGIAAIDPRWWDERMAYLKSNGVACYEQDWLSDIYYYSPEMKTKLGTAAAFTDNMARSAQQNGLTLQYCMATPRFLLQGSRYKDVTTTRVSGDRFYGERWNNFLYTSLLADALHVRPWTDVFGSAETDNLTVSTLSSGPVGIGDKAGSESRENIMRAARADGVIVKPDSALVPTDESILSDSNDEHHPLISSTYTDNGERTAYVFAYARPGDTLDVRFMPSSLGLSGQVYVYDTNEKRGILQKASEIYSATLGPTKWASYIIAPVGKSGIALLGDPGKIVGTGRQRIPRIEDQKGGLAVTLLMAEGEDHVALHGYSSSLPVVRAVDATVTSLNRDAQTGEFTVTLTRGRGAAGHIVEGEKVYKLNAVLSSRN